MFLPIPTISTTELQLESNVSLSTVEQSVIRKYCEIEIIRHC